MKIPLKSSKEFNSFLKSHFKEFCLTSEQVETLHYLLIEEEKGNEDNNKLKEERINNLTEGYGEHFQRIIQGKEKKQHGQYYTPQLIVRLMLDLVLDGNVKKILDPSMGSGIFLLNVFDYFVEKMKLSPDDAIKRLFGIEINAIPAILTIFSFWKRVNGHNYNLESPSLLKRHLIQGDFFTFHEENELNTSSGRFNMNNSLRSFDLIIGNPPYIRQRDIKKKDCCREHLKDMKLSKPISKRSDLYVYFFTRSWQFLKNGGKIAFIIPQKWMSTNYGCDLQDFFLHHFIMEKIIILNAQIFEDATVPTCIVIIQKCNDKDERDMSIVDFIEVTNKKGVEYLLKNEKRKENEHDTGISHPNLKVKKVPQFSLLKEDKWIKFLRAPKIYWQLHAHPYFIELERIVEIKYRVKTGCDDFFYLSSQIVEELGISHEFLRPLARSISQASTMLLTKKDTNDYILDLHDYISQHLDNIKDKQASPNDFNSKENFTKILRDLGIKGNLEFFNELNSMELSILVRLWNEHHEGLFWYLIYSMIPEDHSSLELFMTMGLPKPDWGRFGRPFLRTTCKSHRKNLKCWFNLGKLTIPDILIPETCDVRMFCPLNPDHMVADVDLTDVYVKNKKIEIDHEDGGKEPAYYKIDANQKIILIGALLNSSFFQLFREIEGRISGGKASRIKIYEVKKVKILNPLLLTEGDINSIILAFNPLKNVEINSKSYHILLKNLDSSITAILNNAKNKEEEEEEHNLLDLKGQFNAEQLELSVSRLISQRKSV